MNASIPYPQARSARATAAVLLCAAAVSAFGQAVPAASPKPASGIEDKAVVLSPFEVTADAKDSYEALNLNSLTGVARDLSQLPISADIYTQQIMQDLAVTNVNDLLNNYVAGIGVDTPNVDTGEGKLGGDFISGSFNMRGVKIGAPRRDGLLSSVGLLLDSYNVSRAEIIRGPQALLYGSGSAAGVINTPTKQAVFNSRSLQLQTQYDQHGTRRVALDANYSGTVTGRPLAVRFNGVAMDKQFWRENLSTETRGAALAIAFQPFKRLTVSAQAEQLRRTDITPGRNPILADTRSPYNGQFIPLLLALGQAGNILGGNLNWSNVNSLNGDESGFTRNYRVYSVKAELTVAPWLSAQVQTGRLIMTTLYGQWGANISVYAPTMPTNPTGQWAANARPQMYNSPNTTQQGTRATVAAEFGTGRWLKHQIVAGAERIYSDAFSFYQQFFQVDANGNHIVNPALGVTTNTYNARVIIPNLWMPIDLNKLGGPVNLKTRRIVSNGNTYVLGLMRLPNVVPPTPTNPFGASPSPNFNLTEIRQTAGFAALFSSWFDGRFDTLVGYRLQDYEDYFAQLGRTVSSQPRNYNAGLVYHLNRAWSAYYSHSLSFSPPDALVKDYKNDLLPPGRGVGDELGIKFNLAEGRLSGSLGAYRIKAIGQNKGSAVTLVNLTDPVGINGRLADASSFSYAYDGQSTGVELTLTAKPTRNSRLRFGYVHASGEVASSVMIPIKWNDQFNLNAAGQVTYSDGTVYTVRTTPSISSSPQIPLTLAMMKDPTSPYHAILAPDSGHITNFATLGLNGTRPNGATIGTGQVGLPISANPFGFVPPGGPLVAAEVAGSKSTGYPVDSINLTGDYQIAGGRLKGLGFGANLTGRFKQSGYYYLKAPSNEKLLQTWPDQVLVNPFLSYQRALGRRIFWHTQLNVTNAFNRHEIRIYPALTTGLPSWASYSSDPRLWTWSNTFSF